MLIWKALIIFALQILLLPQIKFFFAIHKMNINKINILYIKNDFVPNLDNLNIKLK